MIITVKGLQKISDRLYIRVCTAKFITILYITKLIITYDRYNSLISIYVYTCRRMKNSFITVIEVENNEFGEIHSM